MQSKARYVKPKSPERVRFEQAAAQPAEKPVKVTLDVVYEQNRQIIENQQYIISLLTRKRGHSPLHLRLTRRNSHADGSTTSQPD